MTGPPSVPPTDGTYRFPGFHGPHYTQVPDEAFDVLMARLTPAEFKVMMYIIRRTFGFKKNSDAISLRQIVSGLRTRDGRQLDHGTGLSKSGVVKAISGLLQKNVIRIARQATGPHTYDATLYALNLLGEEAPHHPEQPVHSVDRGSALSGQLPVYSVDSPCAPGTQPPVHSVDIQHTEGDTVQDTDNSNTTRVVVATLISQREGEDHRQPQEHTIPAIEPVRDHYDERQDGSPLAGTDQQTSRPQESLSAYPPDDTQPANETPADGGEETDQVRDLLVSKLVEVGVSQAIAHRLAETYPAERIEEVLSYLARRKGSGWRPRHAAAWLVAALREGYETLGEDSEGRGEGKEPVAQYAPLPSEASAEFAGSRTRAARTDFSVSEEAAAAWQEALGRLRSLGEWTPALSACFLREEGPGRWGILVPHPSLTAAVQAKLPQVEEVLAEVVSGFEELRLVRPRAVGAPERP